LTLGTLPDFSDCAFALQSASFDKSHDYIPDYDDRYEAFDVEGFLKEVELRGFRSIIDPKPSPSEWDGKTSPAEIFFRRMEDETEAEVNKKKMAVRNVAEVLFNDIKGDNAYRDRVAVTLHCGAIVLSLPQTLYFRGMQTASVPYLDSGLTVLLARDGGRRQPDKPPTIAELHQIQAVARKISIFIGLTYGVAKRIAEEARRARAHTVFGFIGHSLHNAFSTSSKVPGALERVIFIESINFDAARDLFAPKVHEPRWVSWDSKGLDDESLSQTLWKGIFHESISFSLQLEPLAGRQVNRCFAALLSELSENLCEHSKTGTITAISAPSKEDAIDLSIVGSARREHLSRLATILNGYTPTAQRADLVGFDFILLLAHHLGSPLTSVRLVFSDENNSPIASFHGTWNPERISFDAPEIRQSNSERLTMSLTFSDLRALKPQNENETTAPL